MTSYHVSANPHVDDMLITTIETSGEMIVYEADLYNSGGSTVVIGGPASLFSALRDIGIIDEDRGSAVPSTIVPAHGSPQTLDRSLVELTNIGEDVDC